MYHYYINLDHRTDKREQVEAQLKAFGIETPNRFEAIKDPLGPLGACLSHCEVVKRARARNWPYVLVCEDDVVFLDPLETRQKLQRLLESDVEWDVICLGGNNAKPYEKRTDDYVRVRNLQVSIAYVVHQRHYDDFVKNAETGIHLLRQTRNVPKYAFDIYWKALQQTHTYLLLTPLNVTQQGGFSDSFQTRFNQAFFDNCMLSLD